MIRSYRDADYGQLKELYCRTEWYGGVFDEARDGRERLKKMIKRDPESILVCEEGTSIKGTISIIEDGRVAMLYRFVVPPEDPTSAAALYERAVTCLRERGHSQVLVYSAPDNTELDNRYMSLGMNRGSSYVCFWANI